MIDIDDIKVNPNEKATLTDDYYKIESDNYMIFVREGAVKLHCNDHVLNLTSQLTSILKPLNIIVQNFRKLKNPTLKEVLASSIHPPTFHDFNDIIPNYTTPTIESIKTYTCYLDNNVVVFDPSGDLLFLRLMLSSGLTLALVYNGDQYIGPILYPKHPDIYIASNRQAPVFNYMIKYQIKEFLEEICA